ncbi:MAG: redoxin domain-containing protein [Candidatus Ruminococcus intestinipullorum]|nr:redoxin domain-containing protein [Candidatus Ruminococcus intestinipullorum]
MGFSVEVGMPVFTIFVQGLFSFFSPCVLPLIPLYVSYLSGGMKETRLKLFLHMVCFTIGISTSFFIMGLGVSVAGSFFKENQIVITRLGGILILLFGLYQLGIFGKSRILGTEHRYFLKVDKLRMSPFVALIFGFTFSFSWTPCVGPVLASVLVMAGSAKTQIIGFLYIGVYTLGFILPFLAVGMFTTKILEIFKKYGKVVRYTVKLGGILMILIGGFMVIETLDFGKESVVEESEPKEDVEELTVDFTLKDQYGNEHTLSEYRGKTVFLNFWATWCPPCRNEMPDIQKIYEEYQVKEDDSVIILGIAAPNLGREGTEDEIADFLKENGYTYPVLMDETGEIFSKFGIRSYPTTFMIDKQGFVFGYVEGQLTEEMMRGIIQQTVEGRRETSE